MNAFARARPKRNVDVLFMGASRAAAEMCKLRLELGGYSVEIASSYGDLGRQARQLLPAMIFVDPGSAAHSMQVIEQLRAHPATSRIPVIILSGPGEPAMAGNPGHLQDPLGSRLY